MLGRRQKGNITLLWAWKDREIRGEKPRRFFALLASIAHRQINLEVTLWLKRRRRQGYFEYTKHIKCSKSKLVQFDWGKKVSQTTCKKIRQTVCVVNLCLKSFTAKKPQIHTSIHTRYEDNDKSMISNWVHLCNRRLTSQVSDLTKQTLSVKPDRTSRPLKLCIQRQ